MTKQTKKKYNPDSTVVLFSFSQFLDPDMRLYEACALCTFELNEWLLIVEKSHLAEAISA